MRPMGWQVSWLAGHCNLPPSRSVACGQTPVASGKRSPLTVAGAAVGLHRSARALDAYHIPSSLFRSKEAIKGASTTLRRGVVNGPAGCCTPAEAARTIVAAGAMHYADAVVRCSSKQGLAGETGSRCEQTLVLNPGAAPATVSESRRIPKSLRPREAWEDIRRPRAFASPETGLASSSGYLRGGRIGPCYVTAIALAVARFRRAIYNPHSAVSDTRAPPAPRRVSAVRKRLVCKVNEYDGTRSGG
jgi:hypothetical protein